MLELQDLREKQIKAVADWQKLGNACDWDDKAEGGEAMLRAKAEYDRISAQIKNMEDAQIAQRFMGQTPNQVPQPNIVKPSEAFTNWLRSGSPQDAMAYRQAAGIKNALSEGTQYSGQELVPTEWANNIIKILRDTGSMMSLAEVIQTNVDFDMPIETAALSAYWGSEISSITASSPTFDTKELSAYALVAYVPVSNDLLEDTAYDIEGYLTAHATEQFNIAGEQEFVNGTLSGRPAGFLPNCTFGLTSSVTASWNYANICSLFTSVAAPYRERGKWMVGDDGLGILLGLEDTGGHLIFTPGGNAGGVGSIFGKGVKTSPKMPALATTSKSMAFGDFSQYKIGLRRGVKVQRLTELLALSRQTGFVFTMRVDGLLTQSTAIKYMACK